MILVLIPGIGTIGGAVIMAASMYGITLASGWIYLQALSALAQRSGKNFNAQDITKAVNDFLKEKSVIKEFINEAKKSYKK